jgi:hypothetical protein
MIEKLKSLQLRPTPTGTKTLKPTNRQEIIDKLNETIEVVNKQEDCIKILAFCIDRLEKP